MQRLEINTVAAADIERASDWYEQRHIGLGREFEEAVLRALQLLREYPQAFPYFVSPFRRGTVHGFPYSIFYIDHTDRI